MIILILIILLLAIWFIYAVATDCSEYLYEKTTKRRIVECVHKSGETTYRIERSGYLKLPFLWCTDTDSCCKYTDRLAEFESLNEAKRQFEVKQKYREKILGKPVIKKITINEIPS